MNFPDEPLILLFQNLCFAPRIRQIPPRVTNFKELCFAREKALENRHVGNMLRGDKVLGVPHETRVRDD